MTTPDRVQKATVTIDVVEALDVRVGTITQVSDVAGSNKLVRLAVDFGDQQRQVLVGMKQERANPSEIRGLQALFIVNLEPRTMAGEVSEAMLFDIGYQVIRQVA